MLEPYRFGRRGQFPGGIFFSFRTSFVVEYFGLMIQHNLPLYRHALHLVVASAALFSLTPAHADNPPPAVQALDACRRSLATLKDASYDYIDSFSYEGPRAQHRPSKVTKSGAVRRKGDIPWFISSDLREEYRDPDRSPLHEYYEGSFVDEPLVYRAALLPGDHPVIARHKRPATETAFLAMLGITSDAAEGYLDCDASEEFHSILDIVHDMKPELEQSHDPDALRGVIHADGDYGHYTLTLRPDRDFLFEQIDVTKEANHSYQEGKVRNQIARRFSDKEPKVPMTSFHYHFKVKNFSQLDGHWVISAAEAVAESTFADNTTLVARHLLERKNIRRCPDDASFALTAPEGTRVVDLQKDAKGAPMAWSGGKLVPSYDPAIIEQIDGAVRAETRPK